MWKGKRSSVCWFAGLSVRSLVRLFACAHVSFVLCLLLVLACLLVLALLFVCLCLFVVCVRVFACLSVFLVYPPPRPRARLLLSCLETLMDVPSTALLAVSSLPASNQSECTRGCSCSTRWCRTQSSRTRPSSCSSTRRTCSSR